MVAKRAPKQFTHHKEKCDEEYRIDSTPAHIEGNRPRIICTVHPDNLQQEWEEEGRIVRARPCRDPDAEGSKNNKDPLDNVDAAPEGLLIDDAQIDHGDALGHPRHTKRMQ